MHKKIFLLSVLCTAFSFALPQENQAAHFFEKYADHRLQNSNSFYYYVEMIDGLSPVPNRLIAVAIRKLSDRSFIVDRENVTGLSLFQKLLKHVSPANSIWKLSPKTEVLEDKVNKEAIMQFLINYKSEDAIRKIITTQPGILKGSYWFPDKHLLCLATTYEQVKKYFLDNPQVLFIDVQTGSAKEELALPGFDFSVNKINLVHSRYPLINGIGQTVSIKEQSYDTTDIDIRGRFIESPMASSTVTNHANFMATFIAGGGNSNYYAKGVAWGAKLASSSFDVILPDSNAYYTNNNITVQNHSYGSEIDNSYGLNAVAFDQSSYNDSLLLHVFSAGNAGNQKGTAGRYASVDGLANLTGNYKMAKNVLVVGAVDSFEITDPLSSKGPAHDGRLKPDLVAFEKNGTSESAALVSGTASLLQQYYKTKTGGSLPSALARAILINSADDVNTPGPDYATGFGNLNALKAINTIRDSNFFSGRVAQGDVQQFVLTVPVNVSKLKISLVWNDIAATAFAPKALVNDLDLQVISGGSNNLWKPWVLNSYPDKDSLEALPVRKRDSLNTSEQVTIDDPPAGIYRVMVSADQIYTGMQSYYIAYNIDTVGTFQWQYPSGDDFFEAGTLGVLRWDCNIASTGEIEYLNFATNSWTAVSDADLSQKRYTWNVPGTISPAQLRMKIGKEYFYSDTFAITSMLYPGVGFVCSDSILLYWNKLPGISKYQVYHLGEKYMEPFTVVADTTAMVAAHTLTSKFFSVAPLLQNGVTGERSYGFDYTLQGTGCYLKSFTAELEDVSAKLLLTLGSTYKVSSISFEKLTEPGFISIFDTVVNSLVFPYHFKPLSDGVNIFRAKITLVNGQVIYSDNALLYYVQPGKYLVFPVPLQRGKNIEIFTLAPAGQTIALTDCLGRRVLRKQIQSPHEFIRTEALQPGVYFYSISNAGRIVASGKILVL